MVKAAFLTALLIPLYTGDLVRIFAWRLILGREGVLNSFLIWTGLIDRPIETLLFSPSATTLVLVYDYLPFMVLGLWLASRRSTTTCSRRRPTSAPGGLRSSGACCR